MKDIMKAMVLERLCDLSMEDKPLVLSEVERPIPVEDQVLIRVRTCGVCHTELDEIEGRTAPPNLPVIPGHQVVGDVVDTGPAVTIARRGERVGVAWIFSSCGTCRYCLEGNQNLCAQFKATGRDADGGYAEYMVVGEAYCYPVPDTIDDLHAAPLLCAGAIGYRSLTLTAMHNGDRLGLTGFGASAHLVLKVVRYLYPDSDVYVFARNPDERQFALDLGAVWAGDTAAEPPELLHAMIDTTPVWKPVVEALKCLAPGGRLVVNAIRKEDFDKEYLQNLDYPRDLWMEKEIKSVANVAVGDVTEFLRIAGEMDLQPDVQEYGLEEANTALIELKQGVIRGAKVLRIS
jgi:propanol-preferring alcohol dehydrogenase